jgi:transcriptional regulator with XRE-family HTH domain
LPKPTATAFSLYLRHCRGGRSKAEVARGAKVPRQAIIQAERVTRLLRLGTLKRLCTYYNVDIGYAIDLMAKARAEREKETARRG